MIRLQDEKRQRNNDIDHDDAANDGDGDGDGDRDDDDDDDDDDDGRGGGGGDNKDNKPVLAPGTRLRNGCKISVARTPTATHLGPHPSQHRKPSMVSTPLQDVTAMLHVQT